MTNRLQEDSVRKNSIRLRGFDYAWPRIYFVTIVSRGREPVFNDERLARATVTCLRDLRFKLSFKVYVYCLMPDHFHALIHPGQSGKALGAICGAFKSLSTREYWARRAGRLWQRQFFDHIICNQHDFDETLHYIRMNPVRKGLVSDPSDWPYTERLDYLGQWAGTSPAPTN